MSNPPTNPVEAGLKALLLPLAGRALLLPQTAVVDVIAYAGSQDRPKGSDWVLGQVEWRGLQIPLLLFESLVGAPGRVENDAYRRVAILRALGGHPRLAYLAILLQGIPRAVRVDAKLVATREPLSPYELAAVKVGEGRVTIPNLLALEQRLVEGGWGPLVTAEGSAPGSDDRPGGG